MIQNPQRLFRVIPASTLVDGYVDIFRSEIFHQLEYGQIPIASKDRFVVPMDAGNEDSLAADVGRFGGQVLVLTSGDQRQHVNDAEKNEDEEGCPKDFGPRGSGEAAKRGPYHGKSEESRQSRPRKEQVTDNFRNKSMITIMWWGRRKSTQPEGTPKVRRRQQEKP